MKTTNASAWILSLMILGATGCGPFLQGNGVVREEQRTVAGFRQVQIEDGLKAEIWVGQEQNVVVQADENLLPFIRTAIEGERLRVYADEYSLLGTTRIRITVPFLTSVSASGGSDLAVSGVAQERFDVQASGGSELELVGQANQVVIEASGGSTIDARNLVSRRLSADASGGSELEVNASEEIDVDASGGSTVKASGNPQRVYQTLSGGSQLILK